MAIATAVGERRWNSKSNRWQTWSGKNWLPAMYSISPEGLRTEGAFDGPGISHERREAMLKRAVSEEVLRGGTPILQERFQVVLGYRRPVRHWLHALATLLTLGLWSTVWVVMAIARKEDRVRLTVDDWGHIWGTDVPR